MAVPLKIAQSAAALRKPLPHDKRQYVSLDMPDYVEPQLCTLVDNPPERGWVYEIKFNGYRIQAALRSRKGLDWTHRFPEIAQVCSILPECIIDGEICPSINMAC